jgi:hypothetical protein
MDLGSAVTRRATLLTLCAVFVATGFVASAQAASGPDLFVTNARVHGEERYAFQGQTSDNFFTFRVRNRGDRRALATVTEVNLRHGVDYPLGEEATPALDPGEASDLQVVPGIDDPPLRFNYKLGTYTMRVCADARDRLTDEQSEANNCRTIQIPGSEPERFFVVRKVWQGRLSGTAVLGHVTEKFHSGDDVVPFAAKLIFDRQTDADGLFLYDFAGPVTYEDSGIGSGCTWSGGGTQVFGPRHADANSTITFDYLHGRYGGQVAVDGHFYTVHMTCGSTTFNQPGPAVQQSFLAVGDPKPFPFGTTRLQDSYSTQNTSWVWSFR